MNHREEKILKKYRDSEASGKITYLTYMLLDSQRIKEMEETYSRKSI